MTWLGVFFTALAVIAAAAVVMVPFGLLLDADRGWLALGWLALTIPVVVATGVVLFDSEDGVHEWRGGAGPSTVCSFDVRSETVMVGKVPVPRDVTYTVCRDPQ